MNTAVSIAIDDAKAGTMILGPWRGPEGGYALWHNGVLVWRSSDPVADQWCLDMDAAPRDGTLIDIWARRETTGECSRYTDCRWGQPHFGTEPYGEKVWLGLRDSYSVITPIAWRRAPEAPINSDGEEAA